MTTALIEQADKVIAATYARHPIVLVRGDGNVVWDSDGHRYIDFVAGIAVCNLGHSHPRVSRALAAQADTLVHVSNLFYSEPQIELAAWLVDHSFADRVFFCNSGAEANEAAIKLARKYFSDRGETDRYRIISMERSFHGRTMATLSATGQDKIKKGFDPVLCGFDYVPFNDLEALRAKVGATTCAVMLEPVQGEGGVRPADADYMRAVRQLCDETGVLLIMDEIQTGMGRTGRLFAHEHFGIEPDIMTLAKALANGLPIGAMLAREDVAAAFGPGSHGSTFGGTPLVTAASLEVVKVLDEENIIDNAREMGEYFKSRLIRLRDRHTAVEDVRGIGLLLGLKLTVPGQPIMKKCMERGFLINCIQDTILRFIPPLIIDRDAVDSLVDCLDEIFSSTPTS